MKRVIVFAMSIVLLFIVSKTYAADPLDSWVQRPSQIYDAHKGITYGNGLFVAALPLQMVNLLLLVVA